MGGIFLSYRREDSAGWTGRLSEHLRNRFGSESIFMDIDTIEPGADFTEALQKAVSACDVLLAIIGPDWATAADTSGKPRLNDPNDWVRVEIAAALKRNIRVIPVLVGGASVPTKELLPDELDTLAQRQAHELTDKRWNYDVEQLVHVFPPSLLKRSSRSNGANVPATSWPAKSIIIGCLVLAITIMFWNSLPSVNTNAPREGQDGHRPSVPASSQTTSPAQDAPRLKTGTGLRESRESPIESNTVQAPRIHPSKEINLLAAEHGGHLIVSSGDDWAGTIDGKEGFNQISYGLTSQSEAVYAFKGEQSATIDRFTMLIPGTDDHHIKEFELFLGNESPTGPFESLGKFQTQNVKLLKTPYQAFTFPPSTGRYFKVKLLSTYGGLHPAIHEIQLFGRLDAGTNALPASNASPTPGSRGSKGINLLAAEHGGHLVVASGDDWAGTIDGKESYNQVSYGLTSQSEAVYAFKGEQSATIDRFTMLIPGTDDHHIKEFELFLGNESPTGPFESLGKFHTQNVKLLKTAYQEFPFPPVKGKYLKIKLVSTYGGLHPAVHEIQLFGHLDAR